MTRTATPTAYATAYDLIVRTIGRHPTIVTLEGDTLHVRLDWAADTRNAYDALAAAGYPVDSPTAFELTVDVTPHDETDVVLEAITALTDEQAAAFLADATARADRTLPDNPRHALIARAALIALDTSETVTVTERVGPYGDHLSTLEDVTVDDVTRYRLHLSGNGCRSSIPWGSVHALEIRAV